MSKINREFINQMRMINVNATFSKVTRTNGDRYCRKCKEITKDNTNGGVYVSGEFYCAKCVDGY